MRFYLSKFSLVIVIALLSSAILSFGVFLWLSRPFPESSQRINVLDPRFLIAHAGGSVNGKTYLNNKEAVICSLDKGFKYIELDLFLNSDGKVICSHDFERHSNKLFTLSEAIRIWQDSPFVFVTDKISDYKILNNYFYDNRQNVIVEAFSVEDYCLLEKEGYIPMLSIGGRIGGLAKFLIASIKTGRIISRVVTTKDANGFLLRFYKRLGVTIAVYTVNDVNYLKNHIGKDVDLVYTDFLQPSDL